MAVKGIANATGTKRFGIGTNPLILGAQTIHVAQRDLA